MSAYYNHRHLYYESKTTEWAHREIAEIGGADKLGISAIWSDELRYLTCHEDGYSLHIGIGNRIIPISPQSRTGQRIIAAVAAFILRQVRCYVWRKETL